MGPLLSERTISHLKQVFTAKPDILLVYVFGSQARGKARETSDVDLAVLFKNSPSLDDHADLAVRCMRVLGTDKVDVVVLNDASPLLKFEVIKDGKLIHQNCSDDDLNRFELLAIKMFFDTEPLRRVQNLYLKEKILGIPSGFH